MAAGDLALTILIGANDIASPVIRGVAASIMGLASSGFGNLSNALGNLTFGFKNLGTAGTVGMDAIKAGAMDAVAGLAALAGVALLVGGAIAVAVGVVAVHAAADFQQGLNRLVTGAGDVTDNMQKMGQSILGVSVASGVMTGELLPAMYQIISANQRGAQAEDTLRVAAMGSVVEQANVVDVAKALTTAMTDYGTSQYNATQYMNGYTRATQLGKLTLEQLSTSMGPILPLAQNIGIKFSDVAGAMSTMTNAGIPAERAATSLRFLFQSLENPTKKATTAMTSMGLSSVAVGNELKKSLPGALEMIYKAALKAGPEGSVPFNRAVSDMIGGQRSLSAYLALTGTHLATFEADTRAIAAAMNGSKTAVLGWDVAQGNFNVVLNQAKAAVAALFIQIGTALLPVLTRIVAAIGPIISQFAAWLVKSNALGNAINAVIPFFATMFDTVRAGMAFILPIFVMLISLIARLVQWVTANKTAMEAFRIIAIALGVALLVGLAAVLISILLLFALVAAVIIIVVGVVMLLIVIAKALAAAWVAAVGWIGGAWHTLEALAVSVFNAVKNAIVTAFNATIAWIVTAWHNAIALIVGVWHTLAGAATTAWNTVRSAIVSVVNAIVSWLVAAWHNAIAFLVGVWNTLRGAATSAFNTVASAIRAAVQGVISWLVNAWNTAVHAVVAAFQWLYNHNYYFADLVNMIRNDWNLLISSTTSVINWLKTAWQNVISWLKGAWQSISGVASAAWAAVSSAIMSVVTPVVAWLRTAWTNAVQWVVGQWNWVKGQASAIWNAVTSAISTAVNATVNWLKGTWNAAISWLGTAWNKMKALATTAWNGVKSVFQAVTGWISGVLSGIWNSISSWWSGTVQPQMTSRATSAWQGVSHVFSSAWGTYISGPLGSLGNSIGQWFTKFGTQAVQWGSNMLKMFAQGITAGISWIIGAVTAVGEAIARLLGFHSPPAAGPLASSGDWMPAFGRMLVAGINGFIGSVVGAVTNLANQIAAKFTALLGQVTSIWNTIKNTVQSTTQSLVSTAENLISGLMARLSSIWNSIKNTAVSVWNSLSSTVQSIARTMVSTVENTFNSLIGRAAGIFTSVKNTVINIINSLAGAAYGAAQHVVQSIINGINSMLGGVTGAISNVASIIRSHLPFSPAKEGPLRDLDKSMPAMIDILTRGIEAGTPAIKSSMQRLTQPMASSLTAPLTASGSAFAGGRYPTGGASNAPISITVESPSITLDGAEVTNKLGKRFATEIRRQGGVRSR